MQVKSMGYGKIDRVTYRAEMAAPARFAEVVWRNPFRYNAAIPSGLEPKPDRQC
jgi:hypothetical protein